MQPDIRPDIQSDQLELLMVHADERRPALATGLEAAHTATAPRPAQQRRLHLFDDSAHPDDLEQQRWGIIAPKNHQGDRLLDVVAPLIARRRQQQGGRDVRVYRVPARMTMSEAARWKKRVFRKGNDLDDALPRYLLILGDLDQVPLAIQQIQASDCFVGRLAFDRDGDYRAYADKLLRWEDRPSSHRCGHALLYSATDGTAATRRGHEVLMAPGGALLSRQRSQGNLAVGDVRIVGDRNPDPGHLWRLARPDRPSVLFTLSHGLGAPVSGWPSYERQRCEQGALSFGHSGVLAGRDLEGQTFLPGGIWLLFACYGAGTPSDSAYHHWLDTLRQIGHVGNDIEHVLNTLARERPFIAAVPKAALASPDGPLCVVGHIDLAWSYSFRDLDDGVAKRPGRLMNVVQALLRCARAGVALRSLARSLEQVNTELTALYDRHASCGHAPVSKRDRARRGHLWMLRQDLAGYVLLGDPAARLSLAGSGAGARPIAPAARQAEHLAGRIEAAVARVLALGVSIDRAAGDHGLEPEALKRWFAIYRDAGRQALGRVLQAEDPGDRRDGP